jgi:hypothetical protein
LGKNFHASDIAPLIEAFQKAERDPRRPLVKLRGRLINRRQFDAHLKRSGKTEQQVLDDAQAKSAQPNPDDISLDYANNDIPSTPITPREQQISPLTLTTHSCATTYSLPSHQSTRLPSPASYHGTPLEQRSFMDFQSQRNPPGVNLQECFDRPDVAFSPEPFSSIILQSETPEPVHLQEGSEAAKMWASINRNTSFNHIVKQLLGADSPAGPEPYQVGMLSIMFGSPSVSSQGLLQDLLHDSGPLNATTEHTNSEHSDVELPEKFLSHLFGGYILQRQGLADGAKQLFCLAGHFLNGMIRSCHPECLVALNVMLAVLEAQGQKDDAADFLSCVLVSSQQNLSTTPVAQTAEFMVGIATRGLGEADSDIEHLESIYERLKVQFGVRSSSALAGLYHIAWRCAKEETLRQRALQTLDELLPLASTTLGPSHFLTITCMTTRARVLFHFHREEESISLMWEAIKAIDRRYALFHPYRLEALHRFAEFLIDAQNVKDAERILKDVVKERIRVLGGNNFLTERSQKLLQKARASTAYNAGSQERTSSSPVTSNSQREAHGGISSTVHLPIQSSTRAAAVAA